MSASPADPSAMHHATPAPAQKSGRRAPRAIKRIAVTGAAKGIGRLLLRALAVRGDYELIGIDREPLPPGTADGVEHYICDLKKRAAEDLFRSGAIDAVYHLAFEDDQRASSRKRYNNNVLATMKLLDYVDRYDVKRVVVLSTAAVYGAHPHNPVFLDEGAPLRAIETFSAMRDRVEADRYVQAWMGTHPDVTTVILRPNHVLGKETSAPLKSWLTRGRWVPVLLGFDPMIQLLHEDDVVQALIVALERADRSAIYNVRGAGALPLLELIREVGAEPVPIPHPLAYLMLYQLKPLRLVPFSAPQIDFLRYNLIVSDRRIRADLGYEPRVGLRDAIRSIALPRTGEYTGPDASKKSR